MELITTNLGTIATSLFGVAGQAITFITENPLCLVGMILWVFVSGVGIVSRFVKGV